jgi:transposase InsO family protein
MTTLTARRRTYDHRLRERVCRTGVRALGERLQIPRSTVATWMQRGLRPVVTIEPLEHDRQQLLDAVEKLDRRARVLAAVVRLLLALLRASGFNLAGKRLPEGTAKAGILRAISSAQPFLPLPVILRIVDLQPARYHAWQRADARCGLDDRSSCPRSEPQSLTAAEVATIKDMGIEPDNRHMPMRTLCLFAQRLGKVFASPSTWVRLVRDRGWHRPRTREYPAKPKVGVRATRPNEYWHVDTTILKLLDGTRVYIHGVIDNFSRKILAWTVAAHLEPGSTCAVLLAAARHLGPATSATTLVADSGVENLNAAVDATLLSTCLHRVLAQVEVLFSNSMIERFWMSLRHQWLYLHSLDGIARVRSLVESFVEFHNTQMPHVAFCGQTPDEMYFGTAVRLPEDLASARAKARAERLAANRALSCGQCAGEQTVLTISEKPP